MNTIILASQSPRRKQLLEWAELPFDIIVRDTCEDFPSGMEPEHVAVYTARNKAIAVQEEAGERRIDNSSWSDNGEGPWQTNCSRGWAVA